MLGYLDEEFAADRLALFVVEDRGQDASARLAVMEKGDHDEDPAATIIREEFGETGDFVLEDLVERIFRRAGEIVRQSHAASLGDNGRRSRMNQAGTLPSGAEGASVQRPRESQSRIAQPSNSVVVRTR
jgi:hypothetical protein